MKPTLKFLTGIAAIAVLGGACNAVLVEILALEVTFGPWYERTLLGLGVFALLGIAYGTLDRKPEEPTPLPSKEEPEKVEAPPPAPAPARAPARPPASELSDAYEQLRTYIDLEMWELALDRANHIRKIYPKSREAAAIERNINDLLWKAEPKFVEQKKESVSEIEARTLQSEGLSRFVQHIRTYMELEMWELARQKASALLKNFPESAAASEVAKLWPEIEKQLKQPADTGAPR